MKILQTWARWGLLENSIQKLHFIHTENILVWNEPAPSLRLTFALHSHAGPAQFYAKFYKFIYVYKNIGVGRVQAENEMNIILYTNWRWQRGM